MSTAEAINATAAKKASGKSTKALDLYLRQLAIEQTRRNADGRIMLPRDDNPEDAELIPPEYLDE